MKREVVMVLLILACSVCVFAAGSEIGADFAVNAPGKVVVKDYVAEGGNCWAYAVLGLMVLLLVYLVWRWKAKKVKRKSVKKVARKKAVKKTTKKVAKGARKKK